VNLLPIVSSDLVDAFMGMYPAHRIISNKELAVDCGDISLSNQQYVALSGWVNG
jgi:hypothetical protein